MTDKKNGTQGAGPVMATETVPKRKQIPKIEAVRRAMAALGAGASRADLQGYVRQKFGVKIGLDHISSCKADLAKRAAKATTPAGSQAAATKSAAGPAASGKPTAPESRAAQPTPATHTRAVGGNGSSRASILLEDVLTAKILIDRVGAGPLKMLINGLAK
jgi:sRNA-binding protein